MSNARAGAAQGRLPRPARHSLGRAHRRGHRAARSVTPGPRGCSFGGEGGSMGGVFAWASLGRCGSTACAPKWAAPAPLALSQLAAWVEHSGWHHGEPQGHATCSSSAGGGCRALPAAPAASTRPPAAAGQRWRAPGAAAMRRPRPAVPLSTPRHHWQPAGRTSNPAPRGLRRTGAGSSRRTLRLTAAALPPARPFCPAVEAY